MCFKLNQLTLVAAAAGALLTTQAYGQWYVRGEFNDWGGTDHALVDQGGGLWTGTIDGLTPGTDYELKVTVDDWSENYPGSNMKVRADANGQINIRFFDHASWSDGWLPDNQKRVGYEDPGQTGWELIGSMNNWEGAALSDMGNGLYQGTFLLDAGSYEYKFRITGSWDISIGDNFGNSAGNIALNVPEAGEYLFSLDLPNGRYSAVLVPEPAGLALLGLSAVVGLRRRRS